MHGSDFEEKLPLAALRTVGAALALKKIKDSGYLTGTKNYYHGTSKERAEEIKKNGLLSNNLLNNPDSIKTTATLNKDVAAKSDDYVYLANDKSIADAFANSYVTPTKRAPVGLNTEKSPYGETLVVPMSTHKKFKRNPETEMGFDEWYKLNSLNVPKLVARQHYNSINDDTVTIKDKLDPKYIKGSPDYKSQAFKNYKTNWVKAPGKAALAHLGVAGVLGGTGYSMYRLFENITVINKIDSIIEEASFINKVKNFFSGFAIPKNIFNNLLKKAKVNGSQSIKKELQEAKSLRNINAPEVHGKVDYQDTCYTGAMKLIGLKNLVRKYPDFYSFYQAYTKKTKPIYTKDLTKKELESLPKGTVMAIVNKRESRSTVNTEYNKELGMIQETRKMIGHVMIYMGRDSKKKIIILELSYPNDDRTLNGSELELQLDFETDSFFKRYNTDKRDLVVFDYRVMKTL